MCASVELCREEVLQRTETAIAWTSVRMPDRWSQLSTSASARHYATTIVSTPSNSKRRFPCDPATFDTY